MLNILKKLKKCADQLFTIEEIIENKNVDIDKIRYLLDSNCCLAGITCDNKCIYFMSNYTYRIEEIKEKVYDNNSKAEKEITKYYDFIISGDFCFDHDYNIILLYIPSILNMRDKHNKVQGFATIRNLQIIESEKKIKADIIFRVTFKNE